jgi:hypothetical protein
MHAEFVHYDICVVGWLLLTGIELYALLLAWLHIWMWNSDKQASMSRCLCCPKTKGRAC